MGDFLNQSLERQFPDEEFGALLVPSDFSGGDSSGSESVGLLDSAGGWGALLGGLAVELLSGFLDSVGALSCGGFGSGHYAIIMSLNL